VAAAGVLPPAGHLAVLGLRSDLCCVPDRADTTEGAMDIAAAYRVASGSDRCSACFDELSLEVAAAGVQHRQLATLSRIFPGHSAAALEAALGSAGGDVSASAAALLDRSPSPGKDMVVVGGDGCGDQCGAVEEEQELRWVTAEPPPDGAQAQVELGGLDSPNPPPPPPPLSSSSSWDAIAACQPVERDEVLQLAEVVGGALLVCLSFCGGAC
jgi:hypothetical protein